MAAYPLRTSAPARLTSKRPDDQCNRLLYRFRSQHSMELPLPPLLSPDSAPRSLCRPMANTWLESCRPQVPLATAGAGTTSLDPVTAHRGPRNTGAVWGWIRPNKPRGATAGAPFSGAASTLSVNPVQITIGGLALPQSNVQFSGIVSTGLYQLNVVVPQGLGNGDQNIVAAVAGDDDAERRSRDCPMIWKPFPWG